METRRIGSSRVSVSRTGMGTWELSGDVWGKKDDDTSTKAIIAALDEGCTFIDTAAGYGKGHVESLISRALSSWKDRRADSISISTKILPKNGVFAPAPHIPISEVYPADWVISQIDGSRRRLGRDSIDIVFMHTWNRAWAHEESWLKTLGDLRDKGIVKAIGISIPDEGITDANVFIANKLVDVVQCVFNCFQQEPIYSLFPLAKKSGVSVIARSPFSSGVLTGTWNKEMKFAAGDWRGSWPLSVKPHWFEEQIAMWEHVRPILEREASTPSEAAIRFALSYDTVTAVIPGSSNPSHVQENSRAIQKGPLSREALDGLESLWKEGLIHGTYNGSI